MKETPQERMTLLIYLLAVIGDLCNPDPNLSVVDRDKLASVLNWLQTEMSDTLETITSS